MSKAQVYEEFIGKTITKIEQISKQDLYFDLSCGGVIKMYHSQECCEQVELEDVCGEFSDLLDSPILMFESVSNKDEYTNGHDSCTWTFYKIATIKGSVTLRWFGGSNGWYSEEVNVSYYPDGYKYERISSEYN